MNKQDVRRLLRKALIYQVMVRVDRFIGNDISHKDLSNSAGQSNSWFNDVFNNNEDIRLSSFIRVISAVGRKKDISDYKLVDIFDKRSLETAAVMSRFRDEHGDKEDKHESDLIKDFILLERDHFMELLGDWGVMIGSNRLTENEKECVRQIRLLIVEEEKQ